MSIERRDRWEKATTGPLAIAGIVFIVAYSILAIPPQLHWAVRGLVASIVIVTWVAFAVDIAVRLVLTPHGQRAKFVSSDWMGVLAIAIPAFRAVSTVRLLQNTKMFGPRDGSLLRLRIGLTAAMYAVIFVYFVALTTLVAERGAHGANIQSFGDAIWWAVVTISTVGYGDVYPVTILGRFYATLLMAGGLVIVGTVSALVISSITDRLGLRRTEHHEGPAGRAADEPGERPGR